MRFFEYEAREIVKRAGIPVTDYGFTTDPAEAAVIAGRIGGPTVGPPRHRSIGQEPFVLPGWRAVTPQAPMEALILASVASSGWRVPLHLGYLAQPRK